TDDMLIAALNVAVTLNNMGRMRECIRFLEAALALAPEDSSFRANPRRLGMHGWALVQLGDVSAGLPLLLRAAGIAPDGHVKDSVALCIDYAMYVTGATTLSAAAVKAEGRTWVLENLLFLSPWSEDLDELQVLTRAAKRATGGNLPEPRLRASA